MSVAQSDMRTSRVEPSGFDPLRTVWDLLTNVKFALLLVGTALVAGLVGVVLPQVPGPMRGNPAARSAWIALREQSYGPLTGPMDRLGLFDVFHSTWFNGLWVLIIVAVTVCTVSRLRPTWRAVQHPQLTVPDAYFERAHHRASFVHDGGAEAVERLLRKRHYKVTAAGERDGATYLFADRFAWSQYGTFLSHLALLMLLVGALLTTLAGFDRTFVYAEAAPEASVFDTAGPGQMFIKVLDAHRGLDDKDRIIDYHSIIEVRRGDETKTCKTTVNDPCHAFGYKIHQAAWFNDLAHLRITNADGRVVVDQNLDFNSENTAIPTLKVTGARGATLFDAELPQMGTDPGETNARDDDYATGDLVFPSEPGAATGPLYQLAWRVVRGTMELTITGPDLQPVTLKPGESALAGVYRITFAGARSIPAIQVFDMPGATTPAGATVQMPNAPDGTPYLYVAGIDSSPTLLAKDRPVSIGGYTYTFRGQVEAAGLSVKRDPGDTFIWLAVGMAMVGLGITFYVPRRRLWVKVTPNRTYLAGIAEKTTRLGREMRLMGAELGDESVLLESDRRPLE
ncbi:MAG: cytochrome c biogenesis protein ResB [Dehalococcoidia bacterium]|nr:cytochrome c biogenesis protein ResB [Dehalococcoidia bacterium]